MKNINKIIEEILDNAPKELFNEVNKERIVSITTTNKDYLRKGNEWYEKKRPLIEKSLTGTIERIFSKPDQLLSFIVQETPGEINGITGNNQKYKIIDNPEKPKYNSLRIKIASFLSSILLMGAAYGGAVVYQTKANAKKELRKLYEKIEETYPYFINELNKNNEFYLIKKDADGEEYFELKLKPKAKKMFQTRKDIETITDNILKNYGLGELDYGIRVNKKGDAYYFYKPDISYSEAKKILKMKPELKEKIKKEINKAIKIYMKENYVK